MHRDDASIAFGEQPASGPGVTSRECAEKAASSAVDLRYQAWRTCIESRRPTRFTLPLGDFKAPATGWIVVSGRRGHYDFCDTTRAYDLATGAAFISDSCSALALRRGGNVDFDATDRARVERISAGTVPVQNLREAVWMLLFRGEAEQVQLEAEYYPLPPGLVPRVTVQEEDDVFTAGMSFNTGQTDLVWRWVPAAGTAFVGEVTWPGSYDAAEDHAVSLLTIAEEGLVAGCAAQPVPSPAAVRSRSARNLNDVSAESIRELDRDLGKAFDKWKALPVCQAGAR